MKKVSLIDYNMGNLLSVRKAFEAVGAEVQLITTAEEVDTADVLVLPGVGNFGEGMTHLRKLGLAEAIVKKVAEGTPLMGMCLGEQLLFDSSEEAPGVPGLGIVPGKVVRFDENCGLKIPHMGWNSLEVNQLDHPALKEVTADTYVYFVHSFYALPEDDSWTALSGDYGVKFCAAVAKDNVFATQFHPEKSQDAGLAMIRGFVDNFCK